MLSYFLDSWLMNRFFHAHFPVDFLNHVFDFVVRVWVDGLLVDHFFEVGHDYFNVDRWGFGLDCLEGLEARGLEEIHLIKLIPTIKNNLHDKFDSN